MVCFTSFAAAQDIATFSDVQLIEETREAVGAQDAETALNLLTEMQRRGTGIFAGLKSGTCEEVIDLPEGITDWRFKGAARQAYITAAKTTALEAGKCGCLFDSFSFDAFVTAALGKSTAELTDADRPALERIRDEDRRATEARFRKLEQSCLTK